MARDFGAAFNPFDAHRRVVTSLEMMVAEPRLTRWAVEAGIDLLVVDEAHHLRRPRGHPGEPAYRAIEPITRLGRHVLLLTATPLEDDAHGFFRLLQLLRPGEFGSEEEFERRLASGEPLPPCTSSTRRTDIGGLPPRRPRPSSSSDAAGWAPRAGAGGGAAPRSRRPETPSPASARAQRLQRALASGASLAAVLPPDAHDLRRLAEAADAQRSAPGLAGRAGARPGRSAARRRWCSWPHMETLELLRTELSRRAQLATAVFHESLSPPRRDIEVARFRLALRPEPASSPPRRAAKGATSSSATAWSSSTCPGTP